MVIFGTCGSLYILSTYKETPWRFNWQRAPKFPMLVPNAAASLRKRAVYLTATGNFVVSNGGPFHAIQLSEPEHT